VPANEVSYFGHITIDTQMSDSAMVDANQNNLNLHRVHISDHYCSKLSCFKDDTLYHTVQRGGAGTSCGSGPPAVRCCR
jgi:hypothetical protein